MITEAGLITNLKDFIKNDKVPQITNDQARLSDQPTNDLVLVCSPKGLFPTLEFNIQFGTHDVIPWADTRKEPQQEVPTHE